MSRSRNNLRRNQAGEQVSALRNVSSSLVLARTMRSRKRICTSLGELVSLSPLSTPSLVWWKRETASYGWTIRCLTRLKWMEISRKDITRPESEPPTREGQHTLLNKDMHTPDINNRKKKGNRTYQPGTVKNIEHAYSWVINNSCVKFHQLASQLTITNLSINDISPPWVHPYESSTLQNF